MPANRQLSAILFADIQGYTALMQEDEAQARAIRNKFQEVVEKDCKAHSGQIIQFIGDGVLCVFRSAAEAVRAGIDIQNKMLRDPVVPLRIGIHTGDILFEGNNVYGDGINIASRIESFSVAGSVFISGKVFDEIKNQKDIETISLGKYDLENVKEPVEIYAVTNGGLAIPEKYMMEGKGSPAASKNKTSQRILISAVVILAVTVGSYVLGDKFLNSGTSQPVRLRTIAVLPFANLSASKDDEYFADGMLDEILTQLSKIGELTVISRTSTIQYKNTTKPIKQIGEELGVDVLVEGSVQKSNDKLRINVQLINAKKDRNLWAETYDSHLEDIFSIQTEIATKIAAALNTTLTEKEKSLVEKKPTENITAYDFYLRGNNHSENFFEQLDMSVVPDAARMYEQAIRLDPQFVEAYCGLIRLYVEIAWQKPVINTGDYLVKAKEWLDKMLALRIDKPIVHATLGYFKYAGERDYPGALAETDIAEREQPNSIVVINTRACVFRRMGRLEESVKYFIREAELSPNAAIPRYETSFTYKMMRDFDNALKYIDEVIDIEPQLALPYISKAHLYADLKGDLEQASEILELASPLVDTTELRETYLYLDVLKGNYQNAILRVTNFPDTLWRITQGRIHLKDLMLAMLYRASGDEKKAYLYFNKAKVVISAQLIKYPDDFRWHSVMGIAWAGLNESQKAFDEINREKSLMPLSKDAVFGMIPLEDLAIVNTMTNNQDAAITILEDLLHKPFGAEITNSIPLYRMHPYWKPLQNNPRFQQMIQPSK